MMCNKTFAERVEMGLRCVPLLVLGISLLMGGGGAARAAESDLNLHPVHPDLTRWQLEATKLSPAEKGGAEGDAAVTSDRYDMLRYHLQLKVDPALGTLDGSVKMVFSSEVNQLNSFVFDLTTSLDIQAINHSSGALPFTHLGDSVSVMLPDGMSLAEVDSLTVNYHGQPTEPTYSRGLMYRTYNLGGQQGPVVASLSQPAYAKYWWPCKDRPGDKALASVDITVPEGLVGVSNGNLQGTSSPEIGWTTFYWEESYPIASYLISIAISDYVELTDHCSTDLGSEIPLSHFVFPPDEDDALIDFAPMCEMMDVCEGHFGPYPFLGEKYGHAEFLWTGAMEHQTVTSIGAGSLLGDGSRDWLIVHELGHQWFGDSLTPATWADIWLNEGFATYTEALWVEHKSGLDAYLSRMRTIKIPGIWAVQGPVYDPVPVFPGRVIYDKGAWMLHMLRGRMGDVDFFQFLEEWAQGDGRPGHNVTTEDLISLAEDISSQQLGDFLWPYLTSLDIPQIGFTFELGAGDAGPSSQVVVNLQQMQNTFFDNIFPIRVTTLSGTEDFQVHLDSFSTTATLEASGQIVNVELDPDGWVLWENAGNNGQVVGLNGAYPNPSSDGYVYLTYRLVDAALAELDVYDVKGRHVDHIDLGFVVPESGGNEFAWDQRGRDGQRVASGVYWGVLDLDGKRSVRKFTVIH